MAQAPDLDEIAQLACQKAATEYKLEADKLAATIHVHDRDKKSWKHGDYQGDQPFYPASVVKVFFLAYTLNLVAEGELALSAEVQRGLEDMIGYSSNDATNYIVEVITGTDSGPEISEEELKQFVHKREVVNRWFTSLGYEGLYAAQKTWYDGPYGRDRQAYGPNWERRNSLTTDATARIMSDIMLDKLISSDMCIEMREHLFRKIPADHEDADKGYIGDVLPSGTELWSIAGSTSTVRHDLAAIRTTDGEQIVLAIYTEYGRNMKAVSFIAAEILKALGVDAKMPESDEPVWLPEDQHI